MSVTLIINGSLGLTFLDRVDKNQVVNQATQEIIEQGLKNGSLTISLASKEVVQIGDFKVLAYFDFEVYDDTEYEFEIE